MQIDWLTVTAQIVNFLVLVWLLRRFLYRPVVEAMDRREARIAAQLQDAAAKQAEADAEAAAYRAKQDDLARQADAMLAEARAASETERRTLEQAARAAVDQRKQEWQQQVEDQRAEFLRDLRQSAGRHFYALARRALGDLADAELEAQIIRVFLGRLAGLDAEAHARIAAEATKAGNAVTVESRFEIVAGQQAEITAAIRRELFDAAEVTFRSGPEMPAGIELKAGGQRVGWTLESYLDGLESRLAMALDTDGPAVAEADAAP